MSVAQPIAPPRKSGVPLWRRYDDDEIARLPAEAELPSDDGMPMETGRHRRQMQLLIDAIEPWLSQEPPPPQVGQGAHAGGNMFVYFAPDQDMTHHYRGPDVFVALDVPRRERLCWVSWAEKKVPDVVIELLSDKTRKFDKTKKKAIYQDELQAPEYYWYDPWNFEDFAGFERRDGVYVPIEPDADGRLASRALGLRLGPWQGRFGDADTVWLRWYTDDGALLPTEAEMERAEKERLARRAAALEQKLRALGHEVGELGDVETPGKA